jgi:hypothetical protein
MTGLTLDSLVAKAKAEVAARDQLKAADAKTKAARTEAARLESLAEANELRAAVDWRVRALVLVVERWECRCAARGETPQGVYLYKEHARLANSTCLTLPRHESEVEPGLPRRLHYTHRITAMCQSCAPDLGFHRQLAGAPTTDLPHNESVGEVTRAWLADRARTEEIRHDAA